jgi:hypothetical protein
VKRKKLKFTLHFRYLWLFNGFGRKEKFPQESAQNLKQENQSEKDSSVEGEAGKIETSAKLKAFFLLCLLHRNVLLIIFGFFFLGLTMSDVSVQ